MFCECGKTRRLVVGTKNPTLKYTVISLVKGPRLAVMGVLHFHIDIHYFYASVPLSISKRTQFASKFELDHTIWVKY